VARVDAASLVLLRVFVGLLLFVSTVRFVARGWVGLYQGSYGFGTYWRFGLGFSWEPIYLRGARFDGTSRRDSVLLEQLWYPHLALSRGADLFRLGFWWKLRLGPIWSIDRDAFLPPDAAWGASGVAELGGPYNFSSVFSLGVHVGAGVMIDESRTAYQFILGLTNFLQIPFKKVDESDVADYWEDDY
jgi:hypothetical protein